MHGPEPNSRHIGCQIRLQHPPGPGFRALHLAQPASWRLAARIEERENKTKPSILDLGRMNQLTPLIFCVTREAARWIYEIMKFEGFLLVHVL